MSDERRQTGTGWPAADPVGPSDRAVPAGTGAAGSTPGGPDPAEPAPDSQPASADPATGAASAPAGRRKLTSAGALIAVLLALFGFTLVVQLKNNLAGEGLATARQEDLVRILSDLESREERLQQDIESLEASQRQLRSGVQGRQAALQEAARRADELGVLAGTLPARGAGLTIGLSRGKKPVEASAILNAVQELRGAGAEAIQIAGDDTRVVRVVASSYFLDDDGGVMVDGSRLTGPYTLTAIGDPKTMRIALNIPGGVAESVEKDGGNVIVQEREVVDVTALRGVDTLQYARPVS